MARQQHHVHSGDPIHYDPKHPVDSNLTIHIGPFEKNGSDVTVSIHDACMTDYTDDVKKRVRYTDFVIKKITLPAGSADYPVQVLLKTAGMHLVTIFCWDDSLIQNNDRGKANFTCQVVPVLVKNP